MAPVYHTKFHLPPSTYTILPALFSLLPCPALLLPPHMLLNTCTLSLYSTAHLAVSLYLFPLFPFHRLSICLVFSLFTLSPLFSSAILTCSNILSTSCTSSAIST